MTQITIDMKPETAQHIHAMLGAHPGVTFGQLAGRLLDAQVAYRLEVERMKPGPGAFYTPEPLGAAIESGAFIAKLEHPFGGSY